MKKNPGLSVFSASPTFIKSPGHPLNIDPLEDDPFLEEGGNDSDYVPPVNFGRWRSPGHSTIQVPIYQGPTFPYGKLPEDVIHGEVITDDDRDSADRIVHGDHESDHPSGNPFVEQARQDLHTPESQAAVHTLSGLLSGAHPHTMSPEDMDAAHEYLSRHFTGVRVNPHHGTLLAQSPAGTQIAKRRAPGLPAVREEPSEEPTYSLVNRHGTFKSDDPQRLIRSMVAFQIVRNEIAQRQKKKDDDDDDQDNNGLKTTSGLRDVWDYFRPSTAPGALPSRPKSVKPSPLNNIPDSAVFEPGKGVDPDHEGRPGGYVAPERDAPADWHRDGHGTAYSPGHYMRMILDPHESMQPRADALHPGHTFTYARNDATGHTVLRRSKSGNFDYWVRDKVHPSTRGDGFDHPPEPSAPESSNPMARARRRMRTPPVHEPPRGLGPSVEPQSLEDLDRPIPPPSTGERGRLRWSDEEEDRWRRESSVAANDLCPVCASGYLEPYSKEHHECLNCGSLVTYTPEPPPAIKPKRVEAAAKRKPGGLGRGLGQILQPVGDPLNLGTGGSENPENVVDLDETMAHHPLAGEEAPEDFEGYEAPKRILDKQAGEADSLDEHLGKLEFFPIHSPGQQRSYVKPDQDIEGSYWRLTEGVPRADGSPSGWALTADHIQPQERWEQGGEPYRQKHIVVDRAKKYPGGAKTFKQRLPDPGERPMGEQNVIASGTHPIDDDALNRAVRDVAQHGRNSHTYQRSFMDTAYEAPRMTQPGEGVSQRQLRQLSSVSNPGLSRFSD